MISLIGNTTRSFSSKIAKQITRIPSECEITQEQVLQDQKGPNDCPPSNLVNRNPRNLEQLLFERKPRGWDLDRKPTTFWNRLVLEKYRTHVVAKVVHHSGRTVVSASTGEEGISSQLKNSLDLPAIECLGKVLARRCLENGFLYVMAAFSEEELASPKTRIFLETIQKEGISLKEPLFIFPRFHRHL